MINDKLHSIFMKISFYIIPQMKYHLYFENDKNHKKQIMLLPKQKIET